MCELLLHVKQCVWICFYLCSFHSIHFVTIQPFITRWNPLNWCLSRSSSQIWRTTKCSLKTWNARSCSWRPWSIISCLRDDPCFRVPEPNPESPLLVHFMLLEEWMPTKVESVSLSRDLCLQYDVDSWLNICITWQNKFFLINNLFLFEININIWRNYKYRQT